MMAAAVTLRLVKSSRSGGQSARVSREAVVRHHMQEMKKKEISTTVIEGRSDADTHPT